jgi:hypothetical protein
MTTLEARNKVDGIPYSEDVSSLFGLINGTITAEQLLKLVGGHRDDESLELNNDASKLVVVDRKRFVNMPRPDSID